MSMAGHFVPGNKMTSVRGPSTRALRVNGGSLAGHLTDIQAGHFQWTRWRKKREMGEEEEERKEEEEEQAETGEGEGGGG